CSCTYVLHLYFSSHVFSPYFHHLSRPPPLSTLFPYTTLFRSSRVRQWRRCGRRRSGRRAEPAGGRCAGCGGGDRRSPAPPRTGRRLRSSRPPHLAEADGNRTRQTEILGLTSFEDWGAHQELRRLHRERSSGRGAMRRGRGAAFGAGRGRAEIWAAGTRVRASGRGMAPIRLTRFAHGGGCACKIHAGVLEETVRGLTGPALSGA